MTYNFEWRNDFLVGVSLFDEDHRQLFEMAEHLIDAFNRLRPNAELAGIMDDFIEYTVFHFEREEEKMREVDYPGTEEHVAQHNLLIRAILKFKADMRYNRIPSDQIAEILADWLLRHIHEMDRQYTDYFNARGVR